MHRIFLSLVAAALVSMAFAQPFVWNTADTLAEPGAAASGGTITLAVLSGSRTFNPVMSREVDDARDLSIGYVRLVNRDTITRTWQPYGAESYEVSDDGLSVTVKVRPGMTFSDGEPITAADFLLFYVTATDPDIASPNADLFVVGGQQVEIRAVDDMTLEFTFPSITRTALSVVNSLNPLPDHILGEVYRSGGAEAFMAAWGTDTPLEDLVFDGPFMITQYSPDERYTLTRNPAFASWNVDSAGNPVPYLDGITYTIAAQDAQLNLFLAGELDIYGPRNLDAVAVIAQAINTGEIDAVLQPNLYPQSGTTFYTFNWNQASNPFKQRTFMNPLFRRAMSHLTPRESLADLIYNGAAAPAYFGVGAPYVQWYPAPEDQVRFEYDPEAAVALLAQAGFTEKNADGWLIDAEGNELGFTLITNTGNANREQEIAIIADAIREVGVNVQTNTLDFALLVDQLTSAGDDRAWDAILIGLSAGSEDWPFSEAVYGCLGSLHMWNQSGACLVPAETLISELQRAGERTLDDAEAVALGAQLQREYATLQPVIYTTSTLLHASWTTRVGGEYATDVRNAIVTTRSLLLTYVQ